MVGRLNRLLGRDPLLVRGRGPADTGQAGDLRPWLEDAQINRDRNLRLQYIAGMGLNTDLRRQIHEEMLRYRRFPSGLFRGSEQLISPLREDMRPPFR